MRNLTNALGIRGFSMDFMRLSSHQLIRLRLNIHKPSTVGIALVTLALSLWWMVWEMRQLGVLMSVNYEGIRVLQETALRAIRDRLDSSDEDDPPSSDDCNLPFDGHGDFVDEDLRKIVGRFKIGCYNLDHEILYGL